VQHRRDCDVPGSMTFRIERAERGTFAVFVLSGRIETRAIAELRRLFELQTDYRSIVLDLKDVSWVDRDVIGFLVRCEADGVKLENCPAYIREWMERDKD
jgi:anti-anti-sigma regulatory factor